MRNKTQKSILSIVLVLALVVSCFATLPMTSAATQTIYLKGSGSSFDADEWQDTFKAAENLGQYPNVWHLVYTGNNLNAITKMQITFTNGEVFYWEPDMGFSTNGGGNNPGWIIVAPYDWKIAYVDSGNNNESGSFVVTSESGNLNFNISGKIIGKPDDPRGAVSIAKNVGDMPLITWAFDEYDGNPDDLLSGMIFLLHDGELPDLDVRIHSARNKYELLRDVDGDINEMRGFVVAVGTFNIVEEKIVFNTFGKSFNEFQGLYWVDELLTGTAKDVFNQIDPVPVFIGTNGVGSVTFDYNTLYTIVNGYNRPDRRTLNYPGLTNNGDLFYIGVTNVNTGKEYVSFCANAGSERFAGDNDLKCRGYMRATSANDVRFLSAFNYIEDKYGDLNENRAITQTVIWAILTAVDVNSALFGATYLSDAEKAAVKDVMAMYEGYTGNGIVVDVAYMICEEHGVSPDGLKNCQPQIVPIYVEPITNTVRDLDCSLTVTVDATEQYRIKTYQPVWQKTYQPVWQKEFQPYYIPTFTKAISSGGSDTLVTRLEYSGTDAKAVPTNGGTFKNGHTYVAVNVKAASVEGGVWYGIADSSSNSNGKKTPAEYNRPIGYSYNVEIKNGKLIVSFDDRLISASVGAYVVGSLKDNKGNIDADKAFPGNAPKHYPNTVTVDVPANDGTVYLYFHLEGGLKWYTTGEYVFAGWKLDHTVEAGNYFVRKDPVSDEWVRDNPVSDEWVRDNLVSDSKVRVDLVNTEKVNKKYTGDFELVITNADGYEYSGKYTVGAEFPKIDLAPGEYTVTITIGDYKYTDTKQATVVAGETIHVSFDGIILKGATKKIYLEKTYLDDIILPKIYLDDITLPEIYDQPIYLSKIYLKDITRQAIYLGNEEPEDPINFPIGIYTPVR